MPDGLDPDDVVKKGKDEYQKCLDAAMPLIDYKIHALERKYDLSATEDKRKFVAGALKVVASADSESVKEELLKKLRDKTGISYHALERDLQRAAKDTAVDDTPTEPLQNKIAEVASGAAQTVKAVRFILAAKLFNAAYAKAFDVNELSFSEHSHRLIADYIANRKSRSIRYRPRPAFQTVRSVVFSF